MAVNLPVDQYKTKILDCILNNDVSIIQSGTGSGKTIGIPQYVYDSQYFSRQRIALMEPRRIAVIGASETISNLRGWKINSREIGYQIGFDNKATKCPRLVIMTDAVFSNILNQEKTSCPFQVIIIDEVHTRDIFIDTILMMLKTLMVRNRDWKPKVVLLSATMDQDKFTQYFSLFRVGILKLPVKETRYPVSIRYISDDIGVKGFSNPDVEQGGRISPVNMEADLDDFVRNNIAYIPQLISTFPPPSADNFCSVLVFLPGVGEISNLRDQLESQQWANQNWDIYDMHSFLSDDEKEKVFQQGHDVNKRRIILSTNICESSVTIPGIKYVIDTMTTKIDKFDFETVASSLALILASQEQAVQRAGRCGRLSSGTCYRLVTEDFFHRLSVCSPPEILTSNLSLSILQLKVLGIGKPHILLEKMIDSPSEMNIKKSVNILKECGALTVYKSDGEYDEMDGDMTIISEVSLCLHIDPRLAKLIVFGDVFGVLEETIIIAASIYLQSPFSLSDGSKSSASWLSKLWISQFSNSDAIAFYNAYCIFADLKENCEDWRSSVEGNRLRISILVHAEMLIKDMKRRLQKQHDVPISFKRMWEDDENQIQGILMSLTAAAFPNYFLSTKKRNMNRFIENVEAECTRNFDPRRTFLVRTQINHTPSDQQMKEMSDFFKFEPEDVPQTSFSLEKNLVAIQVDENTGSLSDVPFNVRLYHALRLAFRKQNAYYYPQGVFNNQSSANNKLYCLPPFSPLQLTFHGFKNKRYGHKVLVGKSSCNAISLDDHFPENVPYVMTSQVMRLTLQGNISLVESTRLPFIPHLFSKISLLFSPCVQLRLTTQKKGYTSCITGIGLDMKKNPISSERNSDVCFDELILDKDIDDVNAIRMLFNVYLNGRFFGKNDDYSNAHRRMIRERIKNFMDRTFPPLRDHSLHEGWDSCPEIPPVDQKEHPYDIFHIINKKK